MKLISKHKEKEIWLQHYKNDEPLGIDFKGDPFVCMLWNDRENFVSSELIEEILKKGCRYFVAGGIDCEKWHDYTDEIHFNFYPDFQIPDSEHVMTTWHDNETLEEVIRFALNLTYFDDYQFDKFLFILIDSKLSEAEVVSIIDKEWYIKVNSDSVS